jgi:putative transcriptional regulator
VIVNRIGTIAGERGISVKELSERADITYNTALNLIRGTTSRIDFDVLDRVCEVLNAEPGELLVRVKKETNP